MAVNSSVPFASDQLEGDPKLRVAEFLMLVSFMVGSEIVVPSAKVGAWTVKVTFDKVCLSKNSTFPLVLSVATSETIRSVSAFVGRVNAIDGNPVDVFK